LCIRRINLLWCNPHALAAIFATFRGRALNRRALATDQETQADRHGLHITFEANTVNISSNNAFFLLDRLQRELAGAASRPASPPPFAPPVDVREEPARYVIEADLPGVDRNDLEITADQGVLTLRGERKAAAPDAGGSHGRRERAAGRFQRRFTLPDDVECTGIRARFTQGVLEISVPKRPEVAPQRVQVEAA
jgi:HSP20 family protein